MKSIKDIAWSATEQEYRADKAISYSMLSKLQREGPESLREVTKVDTEALRFGSLVDCLITEPETLNERFRICDFSKPSQMLCDLSKYLYEEFKVSSINKIPNDAIIDALGKFNYAPNRKLETRINDIKVKCDEYFRLLALSSNKIIMTSDDLRQAAKCVTMLKTHPFTWYYFNPSSEEKLQGEYERVYQSKFKAEYQGIQVRCMFDLIIVDHKNKVIYPFDLKTSGHKEYKFVSSVKLWNYYIQASLYYYILRQCIAKDEYFSTFTIADPKFIVINRYRCKPMVWIYNINDTTKVGKQDEWLRQNGYKKWEELLIEADFHITTKQFDYPMDVYLNRGKKEIDFWRDLKEPNKE